MWTSRCRNCTRPCSSSRSFFFLWGGDVKDVKAEGVGAFGAIVAKRLCVQQLLKFIFVWGG